MGNHLPAFSRILAAVLCAVASSADAATDEDVKKCRSYSKEECRRVADDGNQKVEDRSFAFHVLGDFDAAIKLDPKNADAYAGRGRRHQQNGDHNRALEDYNTALSLDASDLDARTGRALILFAKRDWDGAIGDFSATIERFPRDGDTYFARGRAFAEKGETDRALSDFAQAIGFDALEPEYRIGRGALCHWLGQLDGALADFEAAVNLGQPSGMAYVHRGYAHAAKGDIAKAIGDFSTAVRLEPTPWAFASRAEAYLRDGKSDLAIADFNEVLKIDPKRADAYIGRANALTARGDLEGARRDLASAAALSPDALTNRVRTTSLMAPVPATTPGGDAATGKMGGGWPAHVRQVDQAGDLLPKRGVVFVRNAPDYSTPIVQVVTRERTFKQTAVVTYTASQGCGIDTESAGDTWYKIRLPRGGEGFASEQDLIPDDPDRPEPARVTAVDARQGKEPKAGRNSTHHYQFRGERAADAGRLIEAAAFYQRAMELDLDNSEAISKLGRTRFNMGDFDGAATAFSVKLAREPHISTGLELYLARARTGENAVADLNRMAAETKPAQWPGPVVQLHLGKMRPDAVVANASDNEERCEAHFHIGQWHILRKDTNSARKALESAIQVCDKQDSNVPAAEAELKRLGR